MNLLKHLDKNNLHHAYLIEGTREKVVPEISAFIKSLGIKILGNPDFCHISLDSFKIEDARNLKSLAVEKGFSKEKKIFIISANNFLLEAQNTLLKMFEEPIENTHFFLIVPDADALLRTLVSRFYLISTRQDLVEEQKGAEKFITMSLQNRINFIKELLTETEDEEDIVLDSTRSKALKFLNSLEFILHNNKLVSRVTLDIHDIQVFNHIFKVREYLRMPGSSVKSLIESVAIMLQ